MADISEMDKMALPEDMNAALTNQDAMVKIANSFIQLDPEVKDFLAPHRVKPVLRCETCNLEFSSQCVIDAHNKGIKHQKKVQNLELMKSLEPLQGEFERDSVSGIIRCTVCKITVNSFQLLATHMAGNKHKSKAVKRERGEDDAPNNTTDDNGTEPPEKRIRIEGQDGEPSDTPKKKKKKKKKKDGENGMDSFLEADLPKCIVITKGAGGNDNYECSICSAKCNSIGQIMQHLNSRKHTDRTVQQPSPPHFSMDEFGGRDGGRFMRGFDGGPHGRGGGFGEGEYGDGGYGEGEHGGYLEEEYGDGGGRFNRIRYEEGGRRYQEGRGRFGGGRGGFEENRGRFEENRGRFGGGRGRFEDDRGRFGGKLRFDGNDSGYVDWRGRGRGNGHRGGRGRGRGSQGKSRNWWQEEEAADPYFEQEANNYDDKQECYGQFDYNAAYPGQYYGYDLSNYAGGKQATSLRSYDKFNNESRGGYPYKSNPSGRGRGGKPHNAAYPNPWAVPPPASCFGKGSGSFSSA